MHEVFAVNVQTSCIHNDIMNVWYAYNSGNITQASSTQLPHSRLYYFAIAISLFCLHCCMAPYQRWIKLNGNSLFSLLYLHSQQHLISLQAPRGSFTGFSRLEASRMDKRRNREQSEGIMTFNYIFTPVVLCSRELFFQHSLFRFSLWEK